MAAVTCARYRPRRPQATPLYRLVETHYEEVKGQWEERFERRYGFWRGFVDEQVRRDLDCGLFDNGLARIRCPQCRAEYVLAFSCRTRELCPSCAAKRSAATAALLREEVLEQVGHSQWVLTMPKMLRLYVRFHRELLGGLARAAWETACELIRVAVVDEPLQPGMVAVVQTAGDLGNWHPHVHALVSRGGWTRAGAWVGVPDVDDHEAELLFRHKVIRLLQHAGLLSQERTELLLSWRHTGFSVHPRVRVEREDGAAVERLARDVMRPPVALERMQWNGGGAVQYRLLPGHDRRLMRDEGDELVDPVDVLARVLMHVPEPRRHRVRYYGRYSNASRGKRRQAAREAGEALSSAPTPPAPGSPEKGVDESSADVRLLRRRWRELTKRIDEVDPLVCPSCQAEMRIIAFILDPEVIDTILRHLARKEAERDRAPPGCPDGEDAAQ